MLNPLNSIDGNVMAHLADQDRENTSRHQDQYECPCCQEIVEEHEFIHELKVCKQCWEDKHGASHIGIDQAETIKGDR